MTAFLSALVIALLLIGTALFSEVIRWHDRAMDSQREVWKLADQVEHHKAECVKLADDLAAAYGRIGELADELALAPAPYAAPLDEDAHWESVVRERALSRLADVVPIQRDGSAS